MSDELAQGNNFTIPTGVDFANGTWQSTPISDASMDKVVKQEFKQPPIMMFVKIREENPVNADTYFSSQDIPQPDEFDVNSQYVQLHFRLEATDPPYSPLRNTCRKDGSVQTKGGFSYTLTGDTDFGGEWVEISWICGKNCYEYFGPCGSYNLSFIINNQAPLPIPGVAGLNVGTTVMDIVVKNQRNKKNTYRLTFNRLS